MPRETRGIRPVIAVTSGDPSGIGPEIVGRFFDDVRPARSIPLLIGSPRILRKWIRRFDKRVTVLQGIDDCSPEHLPEKTLLVLDTGCRERFAVGKAGVGGGRHAGTALERALALAKRGSIEAVVTAPISKESFGMAGYPFAGHTEMLARHLRAPDCQMMMVYRKLRVVPLTRHVPLNRVSRQITGERLLRALVVVQRALIELFGIPRPHIAVAGLNPHAGEGGLIGTEETRIVAPALRRARRRRIRVAGPISADVLFQEAESGTFDAFISMYHDQGLIPFKMLAKRRGVNVTIGLPIIRTSVDHGVAFDIAGKGLATTASLEQAYRLAEALVRRRIGPRTE